MQTPSHPPRLLTLGLVAAQLGVPIHRVAYAVKTRGIRHVATAGNLRLFDRAAVRQISTVLCVPAEPIGEILSRILPISNPR